MKVTVFGATGGIGRLVLAQLLDAGHRVTAVVRNPAKLTLNHPELTVVTTELTDTDTVTEAIRGADAVISALGPSLKRSGTGSAVTDATKTIVAAMHTTGVSRFVGLATPSLADPRDKPHWKPKVLPLIARLAFPNALTELKNMTAAVTASDLDYTIARISAPKNTPSTGRVRSGFLGHDRIGSAMSRADIAAFLVSQLSETRYHRAMPAISN
ncbi:NAD(P)-dependent oxidoreductase [Nocardia rhizosphaerihabitans]|uniref:NAD(P)-dependent oxidoreductase n=1 Tax=Nocardia rhizosphaerihabitans TaxID=1691570 RepID=UPI00366F53AC